MSRFETMAVAGLLFILTTSVANTGLSGETPGKAAPLPLPPPGPVREEGAPYPDERLDKDGNIGPLYGPDGGPMKLGGHPAQCPSCHFGHRIQPRAKHMTLNCPNCGVAYLALNAIRLGPPRYDASKSAPRKVQRKKFSTRPANPIMSKKKTTEESP